MGRGCFGQAQNAVGVVADPAIHSFRRHQVPNGAAKGRIAMRNGYPKTGGGGGEGRNFSFESGTAAGAAERDPFASEALAIQPETGGAGRTTDNHQNLMMGARQGTADYRAHP
jgi:hypothetical protein